MKKTAEAKIYTAPCADCEVIVAEGPNEDGVKEAYKRHMAKKHPKAKAKK